MSSQRRISGYGVGVPSIRLCPPPVLFHPPRAPNSGDYRYPLGQTAVNPVTLTAYTLVSTADNIATWVATGGGTTVVSTINGLSPVAGNIVIAGTASEITVTNAGNTVTLSIPTTFIAPGSIASTTTITSGTGLTVTAGGAAITGTTGINTTGASVTTIGTGGTGATNIGNATGNTAVTGSLTASTTLTATLGAITATNGNLVLGTAGNKLVIHATTAASDSVGTTGVMGGTPGTVTVTTSACTTSSKILYSRDITGGTPGEVSITAQSAGSFTLTSTGNETSTFNYLIIN